MILRDLQLHQILVFLIDAPSNILNKTIATLGFQKIHTRFDREDLTEVTFLLLYEKKILLHRH